MTGNRGIGRDRLAFLCFFSCGLSAFPFSLTALHFLFGDGERLTHGIVEAFGIGVAGDGRGGERFHGVIIARLTRTQYRLTLKSESLSRHFTQHFRQE